MVEGARLESVYTGNRIEGSNPSVSAESVTRRGKDVVACVIVRVVEGVPTCREKVCIRETVSRVRIPQSPQKA